MTKNPRIWDIAQAELGSVQPKVGKLVELAGAGRVRYYINGGSQAKLEGASGAGK